MAKKEETRSLSETFGAFCKFLGNSKSDYKFFEGEMERLNALTQDYLHKLELEDLSYHEKARVATELKKCRQERRRCKDSYEILAPLYEFLTDDSVIPTINKLSQVLGEIRKVERGKQNRIYIPRVLKEKSNESK